MIFYSCYLCENDTSFQLNYCALNYTASENIKSISFYYYKKINKQTWTIKTFNIGTRKHQILCFGILTLKEYFQYFSSSVKQSQIWFCREKVTDIEQKTIYTYSKLHIKKERE